MKFIEQLNKEDLNSNTVENLFDIKGYPLSDKDEKIFARALSIDIGKNKTQKQFFIRTYNNTPLDPLGPEARREIWIRTELKSVSQKTFDYYIKYLQTKNSLYMTRTQRSYING
jgi:hypothetical protein